jgi:hypothetical protein
MASQDFRYLAEKLSAARRNLMAPHPLGEAASFAGAFHECMLGLMDHGPEDFDDTSRPWYETIRRTMDTTGIQPSGERGTWEIKAEGLTVDEKLDFSGAVDELAYWSDDRP